MNLSHLPELFPDADFGFSMRMRPGNPRSFFASSAGHEAIIAERVCCLSAAPQRCLLVTPEASGLGDPLAAFASQTLPAFQSSCVDPDQLPACLLQLGRAWEPDFLLLSPDTTRRNVLRAGCVCFPSNWAPEEKIGLGLESIHSAVPGLNNTIGTKIHQFLGRLRPGAGWFRSNWGISSSPELNQHPARKLNRLATDTPPESCWLRIEHQCLTRLPDSEAVLFGIRLEVIALKDLISSDLTGPLPRPPDSPIGDGTSPEADHVLSRDRTSSPTSEETRQKVRSGLLRALATMPPEMASYKNLSGIRNRLVDFLT